MAATSKLEQIQCIAFAVSAANITNYKIPNAAIFRAATEAEKEAYTEKNIKDADKYVARTDKVIQSATDLQRLFLLSGEEFFQDLFNFYMVKKKKEIVFFTDKTKKNIIILPEGCRIPEKILNIIPKVYFTSSKTTVQLQRAINDNNTKIDKLEEDMKNQTDPEDIKKLNDKIVNLEQVNQTLGKSMSAASTLKFVIDKIDKKDYIRQFKRFLSKKFKFSTIQEFAKYSMYFTNTNAAYAKHPAVLKVWNVTTSIQKIAGNDLSRYLYLDQDDPFTLIVKDAALKKILSAFNLPSLNEQLLSPVDIFMVKPSAMNTIVQEIQEKIINEENLLLSYTKDNKQNPTTYKTILQKYFDNKQLFGLSIKLPENVGGTPILKVIGKYNGVYTKGQPDALVDNIDPFTVFLMEIEENPSKMKTMINELIDIQFDKFQIRPNIRSWAYPVTFNYPKALPTVPNMKSLEFTLFTWDKAGFNGQWKKGSGQPGNWTGGFGMAAGNVIFNQYTVYRTNIVKELVARRKKAFFNVVKLAIKTNKQLVGDLSLRPLVKTKIQQALQIVSSERIIGRTAQDDSKALYDLFRIIESEKIQILYKEIQKLEQTIKTLKNTKKFVTISGEGSNSSPAKNKARQERKQQNVLVGGMYNLLSMEAATDELDDKKQQYKSLLQNKGDAEKNVVRYVNLYRAEVIESLLADTKRFGGNEWTRYITKFYTELTNEERGQGKNLVTPIPNIEAHYVAVQFAWFLFKDGYTQTLIKKKIFLSVFGVITKSGYKTFERFTDTSGNIRIKDILKEKTQVHDKEVYVQFSGAPYIVLS